MADTLEFEYITYRVEWVFMIGTMGDSEGRTWAKELIEEKRFATKLEAEAYRDTHPGLELSRWGSWKTKNSYGQFAIVKHEVRTDLTALQAERDAWKARAEAAEENVGILQASREALEAHVAQLQRELAKAHSLGPGTKAEARSALKGNNND